MLEVILWQVYNKLLSPWLTTNLKWTPATLLYEKPSAQCPESLPKRSQILQQTKILKGSDYHQVVSVGEHYVVKWGPGVREVEGQNLLFLEKYANGAVKIPKLYAMYQDNSTENLFLVMEKLEGVPPDSIWPSINQVDKSTICRQLRDAFAQICAIPNASYYGSVSKSPMPHHLYFTHDKDSEKRGPFNTESALKFGLAKKLRSSWAENGTNNLKANFYERHLADLFKDHPPVFTHSDLQRKDILVQPRLDRAGNSKKGFDISIVDWEEAIGSTLFNTVQ